MKRLAGLLRIAAFAAACCALGLAGVMLLLEESGWLAVRVEHELTRRLGEPVRVRHCALRWFQPAVEIEGLSIGEGAGDLRLDQARVVFGRGQGRWTSIVRLEVDGGRLVLGERLYERLPGAGESPTTPPEQARAAARRLPTIVVRDVQVDLSHPRWGELPIGRVDALFQRDPQTERHVLEGRIVPSLVSPDDRIAGRSPELYLGGSELEDGLLQIHASTEGVPITEHSLPEGTVLEAFRAYAPRGILALSANARISLDGDRLPEGRVRLELRNASCVPPTTPTPVENLALAVDAICRPEAGQELFEPDAWRSTVRLRARWNGGPIEAWAFYGRSAGEGLSARGWARMKDVELGRDLLAAAGLEEALRPTWKALEPRGQVDLVIGIKVPLSDLQSGEVGPEAVRPSVLVDVVADGRAGVSYVGYPNLEGVVQGVPLPVVGVHGRVVVAYDERQPFPTVVAWAGLRGEHSSGTFEQRPVRGEGLVVGRDKRAYYDLSFAAEHVPVDARLARGLTGLSGSEWIWPTFLPSGGEAAVDARLVLPPGADRGASRFDLSFDGLRATWSGLPIPLEDVHGELRLVFDRRRAFGAGFDVQGRTATSESARVRGRIQDDLAVPFELRLGPENRIQAYDIELRNAALRGIDANLAAATFPGIAAALEACSPAGKADLTYRGARAVSDGPFEFQVEVTPREVQVAPQAFRIPTRDVRGRVLVFGISPARSQETPGAVHTRVRPLVGRWPGDTRVACMAEFRSDGDDLIQVYGAGIDPSNRGLVGAFRAAFAGGDASLDLSALKVGGRVDFHGDLEIPFGSAEGATSAARSLYRIYLRGNELVTGGAFGLDELNGILVQRDGVLFGERVTARLGSTPVWMRNARFSSNEESFLLQTEVQARDLPLDAEHLRFFLDEETVRALVEELAFRGTVDVDDARLTLSGRAGGLDPQLHFAGQVTPRQAFIDIGLPFEIGSAAVEIEDLVFENGHVRAWATVEALEGKIADRRLADARMQLTYVEPHLSILDLTGTLEGGELRHLGGETSAGGPAFSIDLTEPFPFDLGLRLHEVDVGALLRGLFESDFASVGVLSGELRLTGDLERLTGIRGDGSVELSETTLWSIPVIRDLFTQLGLDNTAVFERMRTGFRLDEGVIHMDGMQVSSPLLSLVGSGTLDLDGRLRHELQVRYSLVDDLGPLTRLLYFIQKNLLSVSVRGDMQRPQVILRGMLSMFQRGRAEGRDLPLPGFSPLPQRF